MRALDWAQTAEAAAAGGCCTKGWEAGVRVFMRKKNYDHCIVAAIDQSHDSQSLHIEASQVHFKLKFYLFPLAKNG